MDRWNRKIQDRKENKRIDDFIADVLSVCRKHGLSIEHEDHQGGFLISKFNNYACDWLKEASDNT